MISGVRHLYYFGLLFVLGCHSKGAALVGDTMPPSAYYGAPGAAQEAHSGRLEVVGCDHGFCKVLRPIEGRLAPPPPASVGVFAGEHARYEEPFPGGV
jgi:hypothetical protein